MFVGQERPSSKSSAGARNSRHILKTAVQKMCSTIAVVLSLVLISAMAVMILPSGVARAVERSVVNMEEVSGSADVNSADDLQYVIDQAGSNPVKIVLNSGPYTVKKTLKIPAGADIELTNYTGEEFENNSRILRGNGFTGVLVSVSKGGHLTLSGSDNDALQLDSSGQFVPSGQPTLEVYGQTTINHATIKGARGISGTFNAAVKVSGPEALITMNDGAITDNQRHNDTQSNMYGAGNLIVDKRARFILNGGSITKGRGSGGVNTNAYGDTGGVIVAHGGYFEMNGGEVSDNQGFGGGIEVWSWVDGYTIKSWKNAGTLEQQAEATRSRAVINGGVIRNNRAGFGGGGILIFGNGDVEMNGGQITKNTASNGGGVNAMNLWTWGGDFYNEIPGEGAASGLTREEYSRYIPGSFVMRGGSIDNNTAYRTGGGVNIVSNSVVLEGGDIKANSATQQGGGVYVATKSYAVHIYNALVENNSARYIGGGIWTCPTGELTTYVSRGVAVSNNTANTYGSEIAHDNYGGNSVQRMNLADRALGGAPVSYYHDNRGARFDANNPGEEVYLHGGTDDTISNQGLHSVIASEGLNAARSLARLRITENTSYRGGGIGTNGGVIFGEPEITSKEVSKKWVYKFSNNENVPADKIPLPEVKAVLAVHNGDKRIPIETVSLNAENNWKHAFENLPAQDADGHSLVYSVYEADEQGNPTVVATEDAADASKLTLTNEVMPKIDVKALKQWRGDKAVASDRPTIYFKLYRAIEGGQAEAVPEVGVKELAAGTVEVVWRNLDKYDVSGKEYTYSVREVNADGEDFVPAHYTKLEDGLTVTNTYVPPTVDVIANKVWVGDEKIASQRPTIYFKLYRMVKGGQPESVESAELKKLDKGVTEVSWSKLAKLDDDGQTYIYSVREVDKSGEDFTPQHYTKVEDGLTVTNTYVPPATPQGPPTNLEVPTKGKPNKSLPKTSDAISTAVLIATAIAGVIAIACGYWYRRKK